MTGVRETNSGSEAGGDSASDVVGDSPVGAMPESPRLLAAVIGAAVVITDQVTKMWATNALADGAIDLIPGILRFRLTENPGAAFSMFQNAGPLLGIGAMVAAVLILVTVDQAKRRDEFAGMALILGGAVGNLVDRLVRGDGALDGAVIDFIDLSHWPTFNVADSSITVGAVLLLWAAIRSR